MRKIIIKEIIEWREIIKMREIIKRNVRNKRINQDN